MADEQTKVENAGGQKKPAVKKDDEKVFFEKLKKSEEKSNWSFSVN